MTEFIVRTLSSVVMGAVIALAVYFKKPGLHALLGCSQVFFTVEISRLPVAKYHFRPLHCFAVASMVSVVLSSYYGYIRYALISFVLLTVFLLIVLFYLTPDFKDSLAAFLLLVFNVLISGGLATVGHVLIEENNALFLSYLLLVAVNDVMAYVCGKLLGKHPLIKLSPSKTWEGYIGAFAFTLLAGVSLPRLLSVVPKLDMHLTLVQLAVQAAWIGLVGPLGGFFGSLTKRACQIKDFGSTIPGHGGFVDRWDCYLLTFVLSLLVSRSLGGNMV